MPNPLISCIMPTFGRPDFVNESVNMFLAQDYEPKELIVVNDCSGQSFESEFEQVRVFNLTQRFGSLGEKRNFAVEQACGDWLAVWDDDDIYLPWRLSISLQQIQQFKTPLYRPNEYWAYWGNAKLLVNQSTPEWISHPVTIFHKRLWEQAGRYPEMTLGEDSAFFRKAFSVLDWADTTYPLDPEDRFMILRGQSKYCHTSINGGKQSPNTQPGRYAITPTPIADETLRKATESLMKSRSKDSPNMSNSSWDWEGRTPQEAYLDNLNPSHISVGFGKLGRHGSLGYADKQVIVNGISASHALSAHAPSTIQFQLDGTYNRFESMVCLNDDVVGNPTRASFSIFADGKRVLSANQVLPGQKPRPMGVDVTGVRTLELQTRTDCWDYCHSLWLNPKLLCQSSSDNVPTTVNDCLGRAEFLPLQQQSSVPDLCIATVASSGYESWLDSLLSSLRKLGNCSDALIVVFVFESSPELEAIMSWHGVVPIECQRIARLGMASKAVLYSVTKAIKAQKYLCFDVDMLVLGSLRKLIDAMDVAPEKSIFVCRDAANISSLHKAFHGLYGSNFKELELLGGPNMKPLLQERLVVNDGLFGGSYTALNSLDQVIRSYPGAEKWMTSKQDSIPWRNQCVFNLALAQLECAQELSPTWNWQLNCRSAEIDGQTGKAVGQNNKEPITVLHFNGGGRGQHADWRREHCTVHSTSNSTRSQGQITTKQSVFRNQDDSQPLNLLICSARRTGSHMLASALNGHPRLSLAGEILFRPELFELANRADKPQSLIKECFERYNGFIVHRQHREVISHLGSLPNLKILFLTRKNWLARLASDALAMRTQIWHSVEPGADYLSNDGTTNFADTQETIFLPLETCYSFLREQERDDLHAMQHFHNHARFHLDYEEMNEQWDVVCGDVCDFLEITRHSLKPQTKQQERRFLSDVVRNYEDIRRAFCRTKWQLPD